MLNISKLLRTDAGIYTCEAVNSQGTVRINISVIVECKWALRSRIQNDFQCFQN